MCPLEVAVRSQHLKEVQTLLREGADPRIPKAVHIAAGLPSSKILEALLLAGATTQGEDLERAIQKKNWRAALWIRNHTYFGVTRYKSSASDHCHQINKCAPPRQHDLVVAIEEANTALIEKIIKDNHAELDWWEADKRVGTSRTRDVISPLASAIQTRQPNVVKLLLALGADPNAGIRETTSLGLAVQRSDLKSIKYLLAAGASPDGRPWDYSSPLHVACAMVDAESIVKALLERGSSPTKKDETGQTPSELGYKDTFKKVKDQMTAKKLLQTAEITI